MRTRFCGILFSTLAALAGCSSSPEERLACANTADCPSGYVCRTGAESPELLCFRSEVDGGASQDASTDAAEPGMDAGPVDAGPVDAGPVDAGSVDAGSVDAGSVDASSVDAGSVDASSVDASSVDASSVDAGPSDAGPVDAGPVDAGPVDAGPVDAGSGDAGSVDAGPPEPCLVVEDFVYTDDTPLEGLGTSSAAPCEWAGPWQSAETGQWRTDPISAISGFSGVHAGGGYTQRNVRELNMPSGVSAVYASIRFADLCRLTNPTEPLFDGAGSCRLHGKTLNLRLCPGTEVDDSCVRAGILTVIGESTVPGEYLLIHDDVTDRFGSVSRPMADDHPTGQYLTLEVTASRLAIWLDHTLDDGLPSGEPDLARPDPDLGEHSIADFDVVMFSKGASWAAPGGAAAELRVWIERE